MTLSELGTSLKPVLYDWFGWNVEIFSFVNSIRGGAYYDLLMLLASELGSRHMFSIYLLEMIVYAGVMTLARQMQYGRGSIKYYLRGWCCILLIFAGSYIIETGLVSMLKAWFGLPRPFVILSDVRLLAPMAPGDFYRSFPSGHASFAAITIGSLWPVLWQSFRTPALIFVGLVCWSRMVLGVHFPADVLTGAAIGFLITWLVQRLVYRTLING